MKMTVLISLLLPSAHLVLSQTTLPTPSTHQAITSSSRPVPVELARRRKYPIAIRDMDSEVVVENAFFRFPPDMRLEDRSTVSGNTWQTTLAGLKKAPGYRGAYWGREMETPGAVQLLVGEIPCFCCLFFSQWWWLLLLPWLFGSLDFTCCRWVFQTPPG